MEKVSKKDIEWLLNLDKDTKDRRKPRPYGALFKQVLVRFFLVAAWIFGLVVFPFYLLIRTSVFLNIEYGFSGWSALGAGIGASILLLLTYLLFVFRKINNTQLLLKYSLVGVSTLVIGFCLYSLFYISGVNAKNPEVRSLYRSMHPILRVAVTTVTLADGDLVITDIQRFPVDYKRMGLPVNRSSLHYTQKNGYVHAVDLRTRDRGIIRNALLQVSLELMGFRTLRHTGTADHLHVELVRVSQGEIDTL